MSASCPVEDYARRVLAGILQAGALVRLACQRHLNDLKSGSERGLTFDSRRAAHVFQFAGFLKHSKGEWATSRFELAGWQQFLLGCLFGWVKADGRRRFRMAYTEVARKNGKSTLAAALGLYLLVADGEPGAEIFTAATKRDQARIVHSEAVRMVQASPALKKLVQVYKDNLSVPGTNSKYEPLGADANTLDGLNPSGVIIDELHAHKTRNMLDVLETATGARRQPLLFVITTAGFDRHSVCWELHDYAVKVLSGIIQDDSFFAYVAALDEADDWTDPTCWPKANPNMGVSLKVEDLERKCQKAKELPGAQNAFRRLHLNQWTEQSERWLDMELWDCGAGSIQVEGLEGRPCYGGLDLARVSDLSALVLLFPPVEESERWKLLAWFWVPEEDIHARSQRDRVPYDQWRDKGFIDATEGNTTDFQWIKEKIIELAGTYDIREIAYDRVFAGEIVNSLVAEGIVMVPFGQGFLSMGGPTAELERLLKAGQIQHGGNPVLRWMASNVAVKQDPAGNLKPDKAKSTERIDGIVALIMALGRAVGAEKEWYAPGGLLS